jgi:hypothetical protein
MQWKFLWRWCNGENSETGTQRSSTYRQWKRRPLRRRLYLALTIVGTRRSCSYKYLVVRKKKHLHMRRMMTSPPFASESGLSICVVLRHKTPPSQRHHWLSENVSCHFLLMTKMTLNRDKWGGSICIYFQSLVLFYEVNEFDWSNIQAAVEMA